MAQWTIAETINYGDLSVGLSLNANEKGKLFGGKLSPNSTLTINMVTDALRWGNDGGQDAEDLRGLANYARWLYGKYGLEAKYDIDNGTSGGNVIPSGGTSLAYPIDWIVSASSSGTAPIATGGSTVTLDGTGGMPDLRGYNISFDRGGQPQYTTDPGDGSTYFSWNRTTGAFALLNGAANVDERFRITPIG